MSYTGQRGLPSQQNRPRMIHMVSLARCHHLQCLECMHCIQRCLQVSTPRLRSGRSLCAHHSRDLENLEHMSECRCSSLYTVSTDLDRHQTVHSHCTVCTLKTQLQRKSTQDKLYTASCCLCHHLPHLRDTHYISMSRSLYQPAATQCQLHTLCTECSSLGRDLSDPPCSQGIVWIPPQQMSRRCISHILSYYPCQGPHVQQDN